jgi:hypothetical protein
MLVKHWMSTLAITINVDATIHKERRIKCLFTL